MLLEHRQLEKILWPRAGSLVPDRLRAADDPDIEIFRRARLGVERHGVGAADEVVTLAGPHWKSVPRRQRRDRRSDVPSVTVIVNWQSGLKAAGGR
ncbi:MAG: hypothetical protein RJA55_1195 [Acidobacteriota bacterium]|jgi:hypothetical protein